MENVNKMVAMTVGGVLALVGVLGFFMNPILGIFEVNTLHNIIHIVSGIAAIVLAVNGMAAEFNKWFGVVYLVVAILGFVASGLVYSLIAANMADHLLHVVLGVVLVGVGFGVKEGENNTPSQEESAQ